MYRKTIRKMDFSTSRILFTIFSFVSHFDSGPGNAYNIPMSGVNIIKIGSQLAIEKFSDSIVRLKCFKLFDRICNWNLCEKSYFWILIVPLLICILLPNLTAKNLLRLWCTNFQIEKGNATAIFAKNYYRSHYLNTRNIHKNRRPIMHDWWIAAAPRRL